MLQSVSIITHRVRCSERSRCQYVTALDFLEALSPDPINEQMVWSLSQECVISDLGERCQR